METMTIKEDTAPSTARELLETMSRFERAFHMTAHRFMGQGGKLGQSFLLFMIRKNEAQGEAGMRVSDIACHLHVSASNVTQMVTELEDKGFVERKMDASDRRVVKVSLSPQGRKAIEEMRTPYFAKMDELVLHLGEERSKTLIGLLGEVEGFLMQGNKGYKDQ
ncbi:MAG: MarR family transcriptional regulator [Spirochaetota bacterium]